MSGLAYFESSIAAWGGNVIDNGKSLIKKAIIAIEGTHVCNRGKKHEFPADRILRMAENTNQEILNGRTISLLENHSKTPDAVFGNLMGLVECRPVTENDLPHPDAKGMVGKLAIFANTNILKYADKVRTGTIKALSPGIDTARDIIFEVSAVPVAAMPGVAFFSYADVKEQRSKYKDMRTEAIECLDTLIESLRMGEMGEEGIAINDRVQKADWFEDFVSDLRNIFDIPVPETQTEVGVTYSGNPYDRSVVRGFSYPEPSQGEELKPEEKEDVLEEAAKIIKDSDSLSVKERADRKVAEIIGRRKRA